MGEKKTNALEWNDEINFRAFFEMNSEAIFQTLGVLGQRWVDLDQLCSVSGGLI